MPQQRLFRGLPRAATVALAVHLARRPLAVRLGTGFAALITLVAMAIAARLGRMGDDAALPAVVLVASSALAYGSGILVAFGGATQALRRDRDEGVRALLRVRGVSTGEYLLARTLGLALVVGASTVGGTLATALAATVAAGRLVAAGATLRASLVALASSALTSVLLALVALAALGARSRAGGYVVLVGLFVVPELLSPWTSHLVPAAWARLVSLPGALAAFREGLSPATFAPGLSLRAAATLLVCVVGLGGLVRAELARLEHEGAR